jgi:hypothetical protein
MTMFSERLTSNDLFVEGPTPARYWGDQWLRVSEKVLKGLNHQFTNRVMGLEAIAGVLDPDSNAEDDLLGSMTAEVGRLHDLLFLYRSLTSEPLAPPEAIRLQDVLPLVLQLHEHHADLRHVRCRMAGDLDTEPVLVRHGALLRTVLVLLESVAGNALRAGSEHGIAMSFGGERDEVFVRMSGAAPGDQLLFSGEGSLLHATRAALSHARGTVEGVVQRDNGGTRIEYEVRLPSLTATRQQERGAA